MTAHAARIAKPLQKLQSAGLLQSPRNYKATSTSSIPTVTIHAEAPNLINLMHHGLLSLESESSQEPSVSNKTDSTLALGHYTIPAPRLPHAGRKAQYACPGWVNTPRVFRPEQAPAATASSARFKHHLICNECYIREHVAPECILSLREEKQVTGNYESLSPAQ